MPAGSRRSQERSRRFTEPGGGFQEQLRLEQTEKIHVWSKELAEGDGLDQIDEIRKNCRLAAALGTVAALLSAPAPAADKAPNAKDWKTAQETAARVNALPGEKVDPRELLYPPIQGFHPIKKLVKPLTNLESTTEKLDAKARGLEQPISNLNKPMVQVQQRVVSVDKGVGNLTHGIDRVADSVSGARQDVAGVRQEIANLRKPVCALQKPVEAVAHPLMAVQQQLNLILLALFVGILIVSFGTPMVAILLYRNRRKLFGRFLAREERDTPTTTRV